MVYIFQPKDNIFCVYNLNYSKKIHTIQDLVMQKIEKENEKDTIIIMVFIENLDNYFIQSRYFVILRFRKD